MTRYLKLNNNQLSHVVPTELARLTKLTNMLTLSLPIPLCELSDLCKFRVKTQETPEFISQQSTALKLRKLIVTNFSPRQQC